jgi:hypothetical protein
MANNNNNNGVIAKKKNAQILVHAGFCMCVHTGTSCAHHVNTHALSCRTFNNVHGRDAQ